MLCQVLRLRWKTAARTSSHVATCNHMQPLAATCPAATCSHLQPLAATCSHLQLLAATCSHLQPLASGCKWLLFWKSNCTPPAPTMDYCSKMLSKHIASYYIRDILLDSAPLPAKARPFWLRRRLSDHIACFCAQDEVLQKRAFYSLPGEKRQELIRALQVCRTAPLLMPWEGLTNTQTQPLVCSRTLHGQVGRVLPYWVQWIGYCKCLEENWAKKSHIWSSLQLFGSASSLL